MLFRRHTGDSGSSKLRTVQTAESALNHSVEDRTILDTSADISIDHSRVGQNPYLIYLACSKDPQNDLLLRDFNFICVCICICMVEMAFVFIYRSLRRDLNASLSY